MPASSRRKLHPVLTSWLVGPEGLGTALKNARADSGMSGSELARRLGWHQSKVSRIETGATVPSAENVTSWADTTGVGASGTTKLRQLQAEALTRQLRLRSVDQGGHQLDFADTHKMATSIFEFANTVLPGSLQIEPYAAAVLEAWSRVITMAPDTITAGAATRARRASMLYDSERSHRFVLTESVLSLAYGGQAVLMAQLEWLARAAQLPRVEIRVIPAGTVTTPLGPGLVVFDDLVITEDWKGVQLGDRADYAAIITALTDASATPKTSLAIINQAIERQRGREAERQRGREEVAHPTAE